MSEVSLVSGTTVGDCKTWIEVSTSGFEWERDALDFIRERFPTECAYRAWSNFEFIDHDGSINEVDLLVVSPKGAFLVEIKSWPQRTVGDPSTWAREFSDSRRPRVFDNPLLLTNRKAKRLKGLLDAQYRKQPGKSKRPPFLKPLVFLSHPGIAVDLDERGRQGVALRDREDGKPPGGFPGIVESLIEIKSEDRARRNFRPGTSRDAELFEGALNAIGIRETTSHRRAGEWELGELIEEGEGWQEFAASRADDPDLKRRVRIFQVDSSRNRSLVSAAARREFQILDPIDHPGILVPKEMVEAEQGPALIYPADVESVRLDHFLASSSARLTVDQRSTMIRKIAESLMYAHARGLSHRALRPSSILVVNPESDDIELKVRDWHVAHKETGFTSSAGTLTAHADLLIEESADVYLAPEASRGRSGDHLDVFGLGAIAFHIFAGQPPASSIAEREAHLAEHKGLDLAAVMDGAGELQRLCIIEATAPEVSKRTASVKDFLLAFDDVEEELRSDEGGEADPTSAVKGELLGGYEVVARLGRGGTAIAYLVKDDGEERVLKVAGSKSLNQRVFDEGETLSRVEAPAIVRVHRDDFEIAGHAALLIDFAGMKTLGDRIKDDGPPGLELLERWGRDLIQAVASLEEQGVAHRDIKPDNIGLRKRRPDNTLRLTLFDFSLSRAPLEALGAGTPPYLDPFIRDPKRGRWDLNAERFSLAMTLHELATGQLPRWGDGQSDPFVVADEVELEPALFDPGVAEELCVFFKRGLARDAAARFESADEMLQAWDHIFVSATKTLHPEESIEETQSRFKSATVVTAIVDLPLSARAQSALRATDVKTAGDLIARSSFDLRSMTGVGSDTREEIVKAYELLSGSLASEDAPDVQSLDLLAKQLIPKKSWDESEIKLFRQFLGLEGSPWQSPAGLAERSGEPREKVEKVVTGGRDRWSKSLRSVSRLREEIAEQLQSDDGFLPIEMLEEAMLARRGAVAQGEERRQVAGACVRAAIEAESLRGNPRFGVARGEGQIVAGLFEQVDPADGLDYLRRLGKGMNELVTDEPVPVVRAAEFLRDIDSPTVVTIPPQRLSRMAALAASGVAMNDRGEIYPERMSAEIAIDRSAGVLATGRSSLSIAQVKDLVSARYREAAQLPDRPELDRLLKRLGYEWDEGSTAYVASGTTGSSTIYSRGATTDFGAEPPAKFQERLERSFGQFLALTAPVKLAITAEEKIKEVGGVAIVSLDEAIIHEMKLISAEKNASWDAILTVDSEGPGGKNWNVLTGLAKVASERLENRIRTTPGTVVLSRVGLLERFDCLDLIQNLRRQVEKPTGDSTLDGLWILLPTKVKDGLPLVNGTPLPVLDGNEWTQIPSEWLRN